MAYRDTDELPSRQVASALRSKIVDGTQYGPGEKLPSYRALATEYGVATNTAQAAVKVLATEGLVDIRPSSGAFVRDPSVSPDRDPRAELQELRERLARARDELDSAERTVSALLGNIPPV